MDLTHDATSSGTSDSPSAFDLALAADAPALGGGSLGPFGSDVQDGGAPGWTFDPEGPMLPRDALFAEADRLSPGARAALNDYVRGAQRNHGQLYGSLPGALFDGGLGPEPPSPSSEGTSPTFAGEDLSLSDSDDDLDGDGLYPGELLYEDHAGLDGFDPDVFEGEAAEPDDGFGDGFGGVELGEDPLSEEAAAQLAEDRAWLRSRGLDPETLGRLAEKEARMDAILAHHEAAQLAHHQEGWIRDHAEAALGTVVQETGGWNPGPEALREALMRGAQMPEHLRPATYADLMIAADPRGYREFLATRREAGPDLGGESVSAMAATPLETGSGEVLAAARRALGLG